MRAQVCKGHRHGKVEQTLMFRHSIDNFRGLAIIFVMMSHLLTLRVVDTEHNALYFIFGDATSWFLFVSGYLFQLTENKRFQYAGYLRKKLKFVVSPYLVYSALAIGVGVYFSRPDILGLTLPAYVMWSLVVGGSVVTPLWFVPMICGYFLLSPLFIGLARNRLLGVATLAALCFSVLSGRPVGNLNPLLSFVHFLGFYMLGLYVAVHADGIRRRVTGPIGWGVMLGGCALFLISMAAYDGLAASPEGFSEGLGHFNAMQVGKLGLLMVVYVVFERWFDRRNHLFGYLARISFGIFFVHGFFVLAFTLLSRRIHVPQAWELPLLEFVFVLVASVGSVELIRRVTKGRSRYVVGC